MEILDRRNTLYHHIVVILDGQCDRVHACALILSTRDDAITAPAAEHPGSSPLTSEPAGKAPHYRWVFRVFTRPRRN